MAAVKEQNERKSSRWRRQSLAANVAGRAGSSAVRRLIDKKSEDFLKDFGFSRVLLLNATNPTTMSVAKLEIISEGLLPPGIYATAGNPEEAVSQGRIVSAKFRGIRGTSPRTWLLIATRWRIHAQPRKRGRGTRTVVKVVDQKSQDPNALRDAEWKSRLLHAATARVKRSVDPQEYQVFDLCVYKGWAPAKAAQTFGISVGQVYLAKDRVTAVIKEEVKRLESQMPWCGTESAQPNGRVWMARFAG